MKMSINHFFAAFNILVLSLFFYSNADAEIYKCPNPKGEMIFSDRPCPEALRKDGNKWINVEEENKKAAEDARKSAEQREINDRERNADLQRMRERQARESEVAAKAARARAAQFEKDRTDAIAQAKANGLHVIEYVVSGSARGAAITMNNQSSGTEQHEVSLPWRNLMTVRKGFFAYISAQNQSSYGAVDVTILLNGVPVKSSSTTSEYGIASASGKV